MKKTKWAFLILIVRFPWLFHFRECVLFLSFVFHLSSVYILEAYLYSISEKIRILFYHFSREHNLLVDCIPQNEVNGGDGRLLVDDQEKYRKFRIRALSTLWMIAGFIFILYMGHMYIWGMIVVIQIFMARELFALAAKAQKEKVPGFRLLNWFALCFPSITLPFNMFILKQTMMM